MVKNFFLFVIPCVFWWFFTLYMIFGNFHYQSDGVTGEIVTQICNLFVDVNVLKIITMILFFWLIIICVGFFVVYLFFAIPIESFISGFYFDNWLVWFAIVALVLTIIGAFDFELGKFQEDTTHVTGHHYEAEYDATYDKIKIKEVEEKSGSDGFFINTLLLIVRMVLLASLGIIIYLIYYVKSMKES